MCSFYFLYCFSLEGSGGGIYTPKCKVDQTVFINRFPFFLSSNNMEKVSSNLGALNASTQAFHQQKNSCKEKNDLGMNVLIQPIGHPTFIGYKCILWH